MPLFYVYILTSKRNGTLYVGVTNDLLRRVQTHKEGKDSAFTKKYNVTKLIYYESTPYHIAAIQREK